jgi:hypothetical protein
MDNFVCCNHHVVVSSLVSFTCPLGIPTPRAMVVLSTIGPCGHPMRNVYMDNNKTD